MKARKKPVVIDYCPVTDGASALAAAVWMEGFGFEDFEILDNTGAMLIGTLEGNQNRGVPFIIIRGVAGEFYPCACEIFAATYEEV